MSFSRFSQTFPNLDKNGDVTQCTGTPHVLIDSDFQVDKLPASATDQAAFLADVAASGVLRIQTPDAGATAVLQPFKAKVDAYSKSEVATVPLELCRRRVPGTMGMADLSNSSSACNAEGSVAVRGGDIQQLVAQATAPPAVGTAPAGGPPAKLVVERLDDQRLNQVSDHLKRYRDLSSQGKWSEAGKELEAIEALVKR